MTMLEGIIGKIFGGVNGTRRRGVCKWYNTTKGYGFIVVPDDPTNIFLHASDIPERGSVPKTGEEFEFGVTPTERGPRAVEVRRVDHGDY